MRMKERFHTQGLRAGQAFTPEELESQERWERLEDEQKKLKDDGLACDLYMRPLKVGDEVIYHSKFGPQMRKIESINNCVFSLAQTKEGLDLEAVMSAELELLPQPENPEDMPVNPFRGKRFSY